MADGDELDDLRLAGEAHWSVPARRSDGALPPFVEHAGNYLRRAVIKVLARSKEERAAVDFLNGFHEVAKLLVDASLQGQG